MTTKTFLHSGKGGDCIAALSAVKTICERDNCKAHIVLDCTGGFSTGNDEVDNIVKRQCNNLPLPFSKTMCMFLKPLIEAQPYVAQVNVHDGTTALPHIDFNLNAFRKCMLDKAAIEATGTNLELAHRHALGLPAQHQQKWLTNISPVHVVDRDMCLARSCRYTSAHTMISSILVPNARRVFFIGTDLEHTVIKEAFGIDVPHAKVSNAMHLAQLIAGSKSFIANGTCSYWIAVGLGHPNIIHELGVDIWTTYYKDKSAPNIQYVIGGHVVK